jgi:hypothetical protein
MSYVLGYEVNTFYITNKKNPPAFWAGGKQNTRMNKQTNLPPCVVEGIGSVKVPLSPTALERRFKGLLGGRYFLPIRVLVIPLLELLGQFEDGLQVFRDIDKLPILELNFG